MPTQNGLEIKVTLKEFSDKSVDEKLNILYQVSLNQQRFCHHQVGDFGMRIEKLEKQDLWAKLKIIGIGAGSGGGVAGLISFIKSLFN